VDPINPFSNFIRLLRESSKKSSTGELQQRPAAGSSGSDQAAAITPASRAQSLKNSLQSRVRAVGPWNRQRAREVFVEQILLRELGPDIANDTAFAELVDRVSVLIGEQPGISARLDQLLRELAA
jgi:hypothetical protein